VLHVTYTPTYPEEAPDWKLVDSENVDEEIQAGLEAAVAESVRLSPL
jgi:hypothetical protein